MVRERRKERDKNRNRSHADLILSYQPLLQSHAAARPSTTTVNRGFIFSFQPSWDRSKVKGQPIASLAPDEGGLAALICEKLWPSLVSDPGEASLVSDPGGSSRAVGSQHQSHPAGHWHIWLGMSLHLLLNKHDVISV